MASTSTLDGEEEAIVFLDILNVGKDIYEDVQRMIFVTDSETAKKLRDHCVQFIDALLVVSRHLEESHQHIMRDVYLVVDEFQKQIMRLEELHNNFEQDGVQYSCPTESPCEGKGRPKLIIPQEQLEGLRSLGFSWISISKMLGVSEKTLRRRREAYSMSSAVKLFSDISDDEIDHLVKFVLEGSPNSGERMMMGWFRGRGIRVQRWRLRESVSRVDPIGRELRRKTVTRRRVYSVPTPNSLW